MQICQLLRHPSSALTALHIARGRITVRPAGLAQPTCPIAQLPFVRPAKGTLWLAYLLQASLSAVSEVFSPVAECYAGSTRASAVRALQAMPQLAVVDAAKYQEQLDSKAQRVRQLFTDFDLPPLKLYPSPTEHYRLSFGRSAAEATTEAAEREHVSAAANGLVHGTAATAQRQQQQTKKDRRSAAKKRRREEQAAKPKLKRVRVESFPVGFLLMNELMAAVMTEVKEHEVLRTKLFQV
ncbi:hypothetical protein MMC29_000576 [Sticta canariensis]|nr:hypothetical protein [Sticta canariensis]